MYTCAQSIIATAPTIGTHGSPGLPMAGRRFGGERDTGSATANRMRVGNEWNVSIKMQIELYTLCRVNPPGSDLSSHHPRDV